jgi:hypothetical protein
MFKIPTECTSLSLQYVLINPYVGVNQHVLKWNWSAFCWFFKHWIVKCRLTQNIKPVNLNLIKPIFTKFKKDRGTSNNNNNNIIIIILIILILKHYVEITEWTPLINFIQNFLSIFRLN